MAFVAADPHARIGTVVDTGHCMRHVQVVAGVTHSSTLRRGARVRDADVPPGTVIGTFDANGRYANATDGSSHIAILLSKQPNGLLVVDQWVGQPVHERLIQYRGGQGNAVNDGDQFYIAEGPETAATA
jgi:hypothetical protein